MLDFFITVDIALLKFLNITVANPVFDAVMPVITTMDFWRYPILVSLFGIAIFGGRYGLLTVLLAVVMLTITDQLSSSLLKEVFGRLRPCHDIPELHVLKGCGNTKSFPSSHAVNTMAAAIFFGLRYRRILWYLVGLSVLVSYTRIYLGIHYPSDIAAGWLLGGAVALLILALWKLVQRRWPQVDSPTSWGWQRRWGILAEKSR